MSEGGQDQALLQPGGHAQGQGGPQGQGAPQGQGQGGPPGQGGPQGQGDPQNVPLPPGDHDQGGNQMVEQAERTGSDVVSLDTRILPPDLIEVLQNLDSPHWNDGWVRLSDGSQFLLWSHIHPEPMEYEGEPMDDFVPRQRQARLERLAILANRAQRTMETRRAHEEAYRAPAPPRPPPQLPSRHGLPNADDRFTKQVLLNQLATRAAEDTTDPRDKPMFDFLDRVEAEAARAAFQKVCNEGVEAITPEERKIMADWKSKSELKSQKKAEEAARTLATFSQVYTAEIQQDLQANAAAAAPPPKPSPIRMTCPKFNPATDPIGSLSTWLAGVQNYNYLQRVTNLEDKIRVLFGSIDINAQYRLGERLLPTSPYVQTLTYEQYVEQITLIFSPPEESQLWRSDYKSYRQARGTTVLDYIQKKGQLFKLGYKESLDSQHFIEETILNLFHSKVKQEVYRAAPTTFADLITVSQKAVGLIRLMEAPTNPNTLGLASVSHPAPASASSSSSSFSRNTGLVGELVEAGEEEEGEDEGFVEPLTIAEMDFCLLNESDEESIFWESQPDGSEDPETVGEMIGSPQNSPASPEGPCWVCGGPHVKRNCPARLKAVHAKVGRTPRPSRGGRGGRPFRRFEEVRRGAPRRGRSSPRLRSAASASGRSAVSNSRNGILPYRERRVGEISDSGQEGGAPAPEEKDDINQEVGGLYDAQYDYYDQNF